MKILYMVQLTSSLHSQETPYKIQYLTIWFTTLQPLSIKSHKPNSRLLKKKKTLKHKLNSKPPTTLSHSHTQVPFDPITLPRHSSTLDDYLGRAPT